MEKSKAFAIFGLILLGGMYLLFKPPLQTDATPTPTAQAAPESDVDLAGGVTELKIEDERVGTGPAAKNGDHLTLNYRGTLLNGKEFDASYGRAPFEINLGEGRVISGWDKGLVGMKAGGKRKLTIPAKDAYGEGGQGEIPGGATLVFEIELIKIGKS